MKPTAAEQAHNALTAAEVLAEDHKAGQLITYLREQRRATPGYTRQRAILDAAFVGTAHLTPRDRARLVRRLVRVILLRDPA